MTDPVIGLLGATSFVGGRLIPLLAKDGRRVAAFSRNSHPPETASLQVRWYRVAGDWPAESITDWISVMPIWKLGGHFGRMQACGVRRVVALSSTSVFTKHDSVCEADRENARMLLEGETRLRDWAAGHGIRLTILRPTMIYGCGLDRNICTIARIIRKFGFFPILGEGKGLRQPVHVDDVAHAAVAALADDVPDGLVLTISGATVLPYRQVVLEVFAALGKPPRLASFPLWAFRAAAALAGVVPKYRFISTGMAARMNSDQAFAHEEAKTRIGFSPREFRLAAEDMPH